MADQPDFEQPYEDEVVDLFKEREIRPIADAEIQTIINDSFIRAVNLPEDDYTRSRGAAVLLIPGRDYAELPGFGGRSANSIVEGLPKGSNVLDVGCGYGQLGADIMGTEEPRVFEEKKRLGTGPNRAINPGVKVYGFDARVQKGQDRLKRVSVGSIDDLVLDKFEEVEGGFDLVVSSALLYHLPDYWGGILRMSNMLKPEGKLLASTMPRMTIEDNSSYEAETRDGHLRNPKDQNYRLRYYRGGSVFDVEGKVVPPADVIYILNTANKDFHMEYSVAKDERSAGSVTNGGQISGKRLYGEGGLDLSNMFYCLSKDGLGYIIARTPEEIKKLEGEGYLSVQKRFLEKEGDTAPTAIDIGFLSKKKSEASVR